MIMSGRRRKAVLGFILCALGFGFLGYLVGIAVAQGTPCIVLVEYDRRK
jgi:hypothetical protein